MELQPLKEIMNLSGKTAIVTGGAMGIGFGIAYRLAEAGANVAIADMNKSAAEDAAAKLKTKGWEAIAVQTDVSKKADVQRMIDATLKACGSIDVLVNDAGIYPSVPVMQLTEKDFEHILDINLKSVFLCTQAAAAQMIKQGKGGKIINISSVDAVHPSSVGLATYDASKHGVWGFTKNVALELAPHRIWVNAIAPGGVNTPGTGAGQPASKKQQEQMAPFAAKIPMKRIGEPDDIGKVALFLASDLSGYMTGSQVVVDGGVLLA
jgi:2-dehydro-3-deoxy-D-gluconate 5-dehydrogenase